MSNKTVWVVVAILALVGLYYWSMPAANMEQAPYGDPVVNGVSGDVQTTVPATDVPPAPVIE